MRHLTEKQTRFVEYYVSERKTQTEAARLAGYPVPRQSAWRLLQTPRILEAIQIDEDAPAATRVSAARIALELSRDLGPHSIEFSESFSFSEMTPGQLSKMIHQWENERSQIRNLSSQNC